MRRGDHGQSLVGVPFRVSLVQKLAVFVGQTDPQQTPNAHTLALRLCQRKYPNLYILGLFQKKNERFGFLKGNEEDLRGTKTPKLHQNLLHFFGGRFIIKRG